MNYPKRLIEVDLPIKRISAHARREKSIRHGHISTLHIWWARRPLAACRAVICASLWPDPVDENCPQAFRDNAYRIILDFATKVTTNNTLGQRHCSEDIWKKWQSLVKKKDDIDTKKSSHLNVLRYALLDFIADFSNWDNSIVKEYLETSQALTQAAHEAMGGEKGTRPLVVDPFAGGGSIPLEALRVGADAFASDLNPVAVMLNKVVLEYIPKYGQKLADEIRKWGQWVKDEAEKELTEYYPKDSDGATPIAYLWARTIKCEGPGCGIYVPMVTKTVIAQKRDTYTILCLCPNKKEKSIEIKIKTIQKKERPPEGIVKRSSVVCPLCGYATPADHVRDQLKHRHGGTIDARLLAVAVHKKGSSEKIYRVPSIKDEKATKKCVEIYQRLLEKGNIPNEELPYLRSIFNINLLGVDKWGLLFTPRQGVFLSQFVDLVAGLHSKVKKSDLSDATITCLGVAIDKMTDFHSSLAGWIPQGEKIGHTFGRQALGIIWDFAEANPFADISGSWDRCLDYICEVIDHISVLTSTGQVVQASATANTLPDDAATAFITDPPYYDLVPYADLSDFFYVWLKRTVSKVQPVFFQESLSPKKEEIVQLSERNEKYAYKTRENYERLMKAAMSENRRVLRPDGIGVVFFAHKGTAAWESQLSAMIDSGWIIVGSWPIDTEREGRLRAMDSAVLASSIQLVCRPRENHEGSLRTEIGDWRDVLNQLPKRIHDWMPRLDQEGVTGADAIFACLGPALEIFSRYSRVERTNGDQVTLKEYLIEVWAAVAREALKMIFEGGDASGFEEDARLTAMWLWTLKTEKDGNGKDKDESDNESENDNDEDNGSKKAKLKGGFSLEYDAARKISQGLGVHLDALKNLVEAKGEIARLISVGERSKYLFGKESSLEGGGRTKKAKIKQQIDMFEQLELPDEKELKALKLESENITNARTTLDRVHQSMLLFAASRGEALKRFLVDDGVGRSSQFWRLAQSLSMLYPTGTDEKRWVDGVLARKKGLGL